jgi:hypothetical protein
VHYLKGLEKCCVGAPNFHKVLGLVMGTSGWCVVCIGKGVENEVVVVCERTNG